MAEMYFHLWKHYYEIIDLIITPSTFYRKKLIEFRFPEDKVVHVPNFVDENKFTPTYRSKNYFIYLGRLSEEKGIMTLLKAMRKVTDGKLIIIGSGPLESQIQQEISHSDAQNIEMVGQQNGTALTRYIASAMFSVLPSEWYENGPISLMESFACGKPVIGANIGGIPEHITDGVDGLTFQPQDADDLAEKINTLLNDPKRLEALSRSERQKVETCYNRKVHLKKIISIYEQLLK